jgi:hypothetical protein
MGLGPLKYTYRVYLREQNLAGLLAVATEKSATSGKKRGRPSRPISHKTLLSKKLQSVLLDKKRAEKSAILGVSGESARSYLAGDTVPDARCLARLACRTGVDLNWLLNEEDKTPESEWPVIVKKGGEQKESDIVRGLRKTVEDLEGRVQELERDKQDLREHCELLRNEVAAEKKAAKERFGA